MGFEFITAHERYPRVNSSHNWKYSPRCGIEWRETGSLAQLTFKRIQQAFNGLVLRKDNEVRFTFSYFDLYINLLIFFKLKNGLMSFTMTHVTIPGLIVIYPTVVLVRYRSRLQY